MTIHYSGSEKTKKDYQEGEYYKLDREKMTVEAHRTMACDYMVNSLATRRCRLPENIKDLRPEYYKQLKIPIRVLEKDAKGTEYATYISTNPADHYFHAEVYDELASHIAKGLMVSPGDISSSGVKRVSVGSEEGGKGYGIDRETAGQDDEF